jgi:hypothetical protein
MYGYKPNKLKADDDRSFQMKIIGVSRSEWQSVIAALEEWSEIKKQAPEVEQLKSIERAARCMRDLIAGGSDGFELRECRPDEVIIRKPTRAEMKLIREFQKSNTIKNETAKPKQKPRKENNNAKALAE